MSIAYKKRKKAIKAGLWDFAAQNLREAGKFFRQLSNAERNAEAIKGFKVGQRIIVHVNNVGDLRKRVGRPRSHRLGRRFPKWASNLKRPEPRTGLSFF